VSQAQESEAAARREHAAETVGGGFEPGQRRAAVGDGKKQVELAELKATVGQVREKCAFSQRRACQVVRMAVSTYRYRSQRTDEPLTLSGLVPTQRQHAVVTEVQMQRESIQDQLAYHLVGSLLACGQGVRLEDDQADTSQVGMVQ
jgi:hypothetical protein